MNNYDKFQDAEILFLMRKRGTDEAAARLALEAAMGSHYSDDEWSQVQYHADMMEINEAERYAGYSEHTESQF
jgi:hypothetical protein